jgi:hypothetical protein
MWAFDHGDLEITIRTDGKVGNFNLKYTIGEPTAKDGQGKYTRYPAYSCAVSDPMPITIAVGSGIKEAALKDQVKMYPQVTKGEFTVETPAGSDYTVKVLDLSGKTVLKETGVKSSQKLNLEGHPSGIYVVSVTGSSFTKNFKMILQ